MIPIVEEMEESGESIFSRNVRGKATVGESEKVRKFSVVGVDLG